MISFKSSNGDTTILVNVEEISGIHWCRGSIGAYSGYSVIKMKNGDRYEVSAEPESINKMIENERI